MPTSTIGRWRDDRRAVAARLALRACSSAAILLSALQAGPAAAEKARITNIADVSFGLVSNLQADARQSQNICVYSNSAANAYSILATGSGPGSSFALDQR